MEEKKIKLILGSQSPRRHELLKASFLNFEIITSNIEEYSNEVSPENVVKDLALQKAIHVSNQIKNESCLVLGADTIVVFNDEILGKPKDKNNAREILKKLSGQKHHVFTGVAFVKGQREYSFFEKTEVEFDEISQDLLELYLNTGDSLDKAGAYGIQAEALAFINKIDGSYSNVVGLPINKVIFELKKFIGVENGTDGEWRNCFE